MPKYGKCGSAFSVGPCINSEPFLINGEIFSCGPGTTTQSVIRSHPTYKSGADLQACSPTGDHPQVCSVNIPWTESIFDSKTKNDVSNPYFWGWVYVP